MNQSAAMPTDGTTKQGQAVVQSNMESLFDLPKMDDTPNPFPIDPLLLTPLQVHDILHSYYLDVL